MREPGGDGGESSSTIGESERASSTTSLGSHGARNFSSHAISLPFPPLFYLYPVPVFVSSFSRCFLVSPLPCSVVPLLRFAGI